jgi:hypothetical protein
MIATVSLREIGMLPNSIVVVVVKGSMKHSMLIFMA